MEFDDEIGHGILDGTTVAKRVTKVHKQNFEGILIAKEIIMKDVANQHGKCNDFYTFIMLPCQFDSILVREGLGTSNKGECTRTKFNLMTQILKLTQFNLFLSVQRRLMSLDLQLTTLLFYC